MNEKTLVRKIMKWLGEQPDCWCVKVVGSPYGRRGVPDVLFCCRGRFVGAEVKLPGGQLTDSQGHELDRIARAGGMSVVATTVDAVKLAVEEIRRGT